MVKYNIKNDRVGKKKYIKNMKPFITFLFCLLLSCFFISCFFGADSNRKGHVLIHGLMEGSPSLIKNYQLSFFINKKKYDNAGEIYLDEKFRHGSDPSFENTRIKEYSFGFCHAFFSDYKSGCGNVRTGGFDMSVILENVETGTKIPLGVKYVKMGEYMETYLLTQVFLGSDRSIYKNRPHNNFNWDLAKQTYSEDIQDTIFYYFKKYKRDSIPPYFEASYEVSRYMEVP